MSEIVDEQGNALLWPEGVPLPLSREVAFLGAQFHKDTGEDLTHGHVYQIALTVARKHMDMCEDSQTEEEHNLHWRQFTEAMDTVASANRSGFEDRLMPNPPGELL